MHRNNIDFCMTPFPTASFLASGNLALREKKFEVAIANYVRALQDIPGLSQIIIGNIELARNKLAHSRHPDCQRVALCGNLKSIHRMKILAALHQSSMHSSSQSSSHSSIAKVALLDCKLTGSAAISTADVMDTPIHSLTLSNDSQLLSEATEFVVANPYDLIHLIGPSPINMLLGSLYTLLWTAQVLIDIDDDTAFPSLGALTTSQGTEIPEPEQWDSVIWRNRVATWIDEFDGITVTNPALQARHGGFLVRNSWSEASSSHILSMRQSGRGRFGLGKDSKVILLLAGPSGNRSILAAAQAISIMPRRDIVLAVVSQFNDTNAALKTNLDQIPNARCLFLETDGGFEQAAALADAWLLLNQDGHAEFSAQSANSEGVWGIPSILADAFARRIPVFADSVPALLDAVALGAVISVNADTLAMHIGQWLEAPESLSTVLEAGEQFFATELAASLQLARLKAITRQPPPPLPNSRWADALRSLGAGLPNTAGLFRPLIGIRELRAGADSLLLREQRSLQTRLTGYITQFGFNSETANQFAKKLQISDKANFLHNLFLGATGRKPETHEITHYLDGMTHKWNKFDVLCAVFGSQESQTWRLHHRDTLFTDDSLAPELVKVSADIVQQPLVNISLPQFAEPLISVIIPVYGKVDYTLMCLKSIQANLPQVSFEVLVVDDKSPDNTLQTLRQIPSVIVVENTKNLGFIRSCNHGASRARGKYLCFLNNDTEVKPEWLDALVRTFNDFPGTGLAGSKLVYPDGRLQEAGGILWQDGSAWNYGRLQDPNLPIFNYAREVDYCSGASIMLERSLFDQLGGFDEHYLPAYCEDSDLALKVRAAGLRVIYQPLSTVVHYEGITSGTDTGQGVKAYQVVNSKKLFARWQSRLEQYQPNGQQVDKAKDRTARYRALVIDHCTPTPNQDAGSVTTYNMLILLREMGFQVTFVPEDNFLYMPEYTTALQRQGIEVLYAPYVTSLPQHLSECGERYDLAFLFRPGVVERHLETIRKHCSRAKVLFHTIDLHHLRMTREAELLAEPARMKDANTMKLREFAAIRASDATIVHSTAELELLQPELPDEVIHVFPLILDIRGSKVTFEQRHDIVFVGGYQHVPNIDAVQYFVYEIMPLLRKQLPGVRFFAVGSKPPADITALAADDVIITGFVDDLPPFLDKIRISVAPLRYGAGIKGKIGTAMAVGLPTVATSLAAEGMLLTDGENILIADGAQAFADAVKHLYLDQTRWQKIQQNALDCAQEQWGANAAWRILRQILEALGMPIPAAKFPLTLYR